MKRKILLGALLWTLLITLAHLQLNIGWSSLAERAKVALGQVRREMLVGFLPVT